MFSLSSVAPLFHLFVFSLFGCSSNETFTFFFLRYGLSLCSCAAINNIFPCHRFYCKYFIFPFSFFSFISFPCFCSLNNILTTLPIENIGDILGLCENIFSCWWSTSPPLLNYHIPIIVAALCKKNHWMIWCSNIRWCLLILYILPFFSFKKPFYHLIHIQP